MMFLQTCYVHPCFMSFAFILPLSWKALTPETHVAESLTFFKTLLKWHLASEVLSHFSILSSTLIHPFIYLLCFSLNDLLSYDLLHILLNFFAYHFTLDLEMNNYSMWVIYLFFYICRYCHMFRLRSIRTTEEMLNKDGFEEVTFYKECVQNQKYLEIHNFKNEITNLNQNYLAYIAF